MRKRSDVVVSEQRVEESVEQAVDQKMVEQHVQEAALLGSPIDRAAEVAALEPIWAVTDPNATPSVQFTAESLNGCKEMAAS